MKIYDLLDVLDIFWDILLEPPQPLMETKWGQHGDNMGTTWGQCGDNMGTTGMWRQHGDHGDVETMWGQHGDNMGTT